MSMHVIALICCCDYRFHTNNHQNVVPCNHAREAFRALFEEMVVEVTHR